MRGQREKKQSQKEKGIKRERVCVLVSVREKERVWGYRKRKEWSEKEIGIKKRQNQCVNKRKRNKENRVLGVRERKEKE